MTILTWSAKNKRFYYGNLDISTQQIKPIKSSLLKVSKTIVKYEGQDQAVVQLSQNCNLKPSGRNEKDLLKAVLSLK